MGEQRHIKEKKKPKQDKPKPVKAHEVAVQSEPVKSPEITKQGTKRP